MKIGDLTLALAANGTNASLTFGCKAVLWPATQHW